VRTYKALELRNHLTPDPSPRGEGKCGLPEFDSLNLNIMIYSLPVAEVILIPAESFSEVAETILINAEGILNVAEVFLILAEDFLEVAETILIPAERFLEVAEVILDSTEIILKAAEVVLDFAAFNIIFEVSDWRISYYLFDLNSMPLTCLYSRLVAPKSDLIYTLTSNARSVRPVVGWYSTLSRAIRALLNATAACFA
jgi:hypothetical protein